jgi:hypothetical protein
MSLETANDVLRRAREASAESFQHDSELRAALRDLVFASPGATDDEAWWDGREADGALAYRLLAEKGVAAETEELTRRLVAGSKDTVAFGHELTWAATDRAVRYAAEDPAWIEILLPRLRAGWPGFLRFEHVVEKIAPALDALRTAAPRLRPILEDPGSHIEARTGVMRTLAALGAREIVPSLIEMLRRAETFTWVSSVTDLEQSEPALAINAAEALEFLGADDDDAMEALAGALAQPHTGAARLRGACADLASRRHGGRLVRPRPRMERSGDRRTRTLVSGEGVPMDARSGGRSAAPGGGE